MNQLKIILPMAGVGKRLFPLTQHRPKPLVRLADGRLLDHVLATFRELENAFALEYVFIIGYLGDQIKAHMRQAHPDKKVTYYVQDQLLGQSHAVYLAKESITGPVLLTFGDTINRVNYSFLAGEPPEGVAGVQEVEDPRRHGVAILNSEHVITRLVEKPATLEHRLALTGLYYFSAGERLIEAIAAQIRNGFSLNDEYYLADAINILIQDGMRIRTERVLEWLDAGTPEALLETNAHLIGGQSESSQWLKRRKSNIVLEPAYVHESSQVEDSIIGPNVSIGANCVIQSSILRNTIVDDGSVIIEACLADALVGQGCSISAQSVPSVVGDFSQIQLHHNIQRMDQNPS